MGTRQIEDVNAISCSSEMAPWDVPGRYSRPICRRIIEEADVPRGAFATQKKAGSVLLRDQHSFLTPALKKDYLRWLKEHAQA